MTDAGLLAVRTLRAASRTDPGRVRTNNEDVALIDQERGVYGVIDGVGGHAAGEVAAALAREVILQRLKRPLGTPRERVREAIAIANNEIFRRAGESTELQGMACVVTLALIADGRLTIGHVGDSRLYKLRPGELCKLTSDHSPVGEREDAQEISEIDAMRHPRRHEVFRDVGSEYRDKDAEDFVDVIEEPMEDDCAILLCTDGLTDMVASVAMERIVRQYAGRPHEVVNALIVAANAAGGKDNVTAVYVEGPAFAAASGCTRRGSAGGRSAAGTSTGTRMGRAASFGRWVVASRSTWFAVGALLGVTAVLALAFRAGEGTASDPRTLVVGPAGSAAFMGIVDAMSGARAGDVVRLEPGTYAERIVVPDGVDLVARAPGSATLVRPTGASGDWIAVTASGEQGGRIAGIRIESTPELPVDVGMRISGHGRAIELVEIIGTTRAGIEVLQASTAAIQGCLLSAGPAVSLAEGAQVSVTGNTFLHVGRSKQPPIVLAGSAQAILTRNVFAGFGADLAKAFPFDESRSLLSGNYVVGAEPSLIR
jgi:serine/threonine protein phosphatase PrpC